MSGLFLCWDTGFHWTSSQLFRPVLFCIKHVWTLPSAAYNTTYSTYNAAYTVPIQVQTWPDSVFLCTLIYVTITLIISLKKTSCNSSDWEPRKVEGSRTASILMTGGGGDFIIKISLLEWEGYPIAPNHESLIFMPIPSIYCPLSITDIGWNMIPKNNHAFL